MLEETLIVSEDFYSVQGEGASVGIPAVFLRLSGCNLRCEGFSYLHPETKEHLGCDTKHVWQKGFKRSYQQILDEWQTKGWLEKLAQGAHLVISGGEPLIQQNGLMGFIAQLDHAAKNIYIELETNGTFLPNPALLERLSQINVSPKLINSGEPRNKAFNPEVITCFAEKDKAKFKFVVSTKKDIQEILTQYVTPFAIPHNRIWLMPEGGTVASIKEKSQWIVEICKNNLMNYSPRIHIDIWDETTGV